ncbi:MAG: transglycosylase SLT domain-containing protein [Actinomycetota bacterium]|nr:transglycosylase SLT domain-containing protein [Actinomycetota bacterium]
MIAAVGHAGRPHRAPAKSPVRANTVVGATAALGAVVTGSLIAAAHPGSTRSVADAAGINLTPTDLANASQALDYHQSGSHKAAYKSANLESGSMSTALLPVAAPGEHFEASDKRDVEMLHKAEKLAIEAAAVHAAASKEAFLLSGGGGLDDWIRLALVKMDMSQSLAPSIRAIIMKESQGNPRAVNRSDSNAWAGRPSQGLMQTIPSTFRAYVLPEFAHLPITNPVANITAGVRYMVANYGLRTVLHGGRTDAAGRYLGY